MRRFPGAKWWKVDFHTHTPASDDYGKGPDQPALKATSPEEWLLGFMRAEIDCIVITDHNSGAWIDRLKDALASLTEGPHPEYRPLFLFPGVEVTANAGVHVLAIFDTSATTADIDRLLGAVRVRTAGGSSQQPCDCSPVQVISEIAAAGAIPVFAHVDEPKGLFEELKGSTLIPILESSDVFAMEIRNEAYAKPTLYAEKKARWAGILGSDSHHPAGADGNRFPGSHYTWVKMGEPTLEGVRLALLDSAPLSIRRSDQGGDNPNTCASLYIEELKVEEAQYCGRRTPLVAAFNPWLNAVIGGRGSGKSSLVEFARIALRRDDELPASLRAPFAEFKQVPSGRDTKGALTGDTRITVRLNKDNNRYLVRWDQGGELHPIQEENGDNWEDAPGDVRQRFPVRIFSQKQVFALAEEEEALLKIIDEAPVVDKSAWDHKWTLEQANFLALMAQLRTLQVQLGEESKIKGERDDVLKKLKVFEEHEHAALLKDYQLCRRQAKAVQDVLASFDTHENALREFAKEFFAPPIDRQLFDVASVRDAQALEWIDTQCREVAAIAEEIDALADRVRSKKQAAKDALQAFEWLTNYQQIRTAYQALVQTLQDQGVEDPSQYESLVQKRQEVEARLQEIDAIRQSLASVRTEAAESFGRLIALRDELTALRVEFVTEALQGNRHVRIKVLMYGRSRTAAEKQFRSLVGRQDGTFANEILSEDREQGLIAKLYESLPSTNEDASTTIAARLATLKDDLTNSANGLDDTKFGMRFTNNCLRQLQPEVLDRIMCWFPEDSLSVEYSPDGDGVNFKPLQKGSPGQKTAAILAFILAHGTEPIILDQPEDDLDNHLIYDLIVSQIRANKLRRQVIVVTHNPNIVVNGDAEAVFALGQRSGQCNIVADGCLQLTKVRHEVCQIMEGGRDAFEKRYRRIIGSV